MTEKLKQGAAAAMHVWAMRLQLHKYHGSGNDFLLCDNRSGTISLSIRQIRFLCDRHLGVGADGLMLLSAPGGREADFCMEYYNPDGSSGMMCGNGGRCMAVFARESGVRGKFVEGGYRFAAPDGFHEAEFVDDHDGRGSCQDGKWRVRLSMKDVRDIIRLSGDEYFLDTGTRHLVKFVTSLDAYPVAEEGSRLRYDSRFSPEGVNVNFVRILSGNRREIEVRTYEKGVEAPTLACGTGVVASALAAFCKENGGCGLDGDVQKGAVEPASNLYMKGVVSEKVVYRVFSCIDTLEVSFVPGRGAFSSVRLTGGVQKVFSLVTDIPDDECLLSAET